MAKATRKYADCRSNYKGNRDRSRIKDKREGTSRKQSLSAAQDIKG